MDARGDCPNIWEALAPHRAVICLVGNNKEGNIAFLSYYIVLRCVVLCCREQQREDWFLWTETFVIPIALIPTAQPACCAFSNWSQMKMALVTPFTFNLVDSPKDMQKNNYAPLKETAWHGYILVNRIHSKSGAIERTLRIKTIKSSLIPGFTLVGCGAWPNVETVIYRIASRRPFSIARCAYLPVSMVMTMMMMMNHSLWIHWKAADL